MKHIFLKIIVLVATFFALISCDKDYNSLDTDLADDSHFNLEVDSLSTVIAYSKETGAVQSNNLPINALGIYNNSVFGKTTAHFVTQVSLAATNPTIGTNITMHAVQDSVCLYVPYFSHLDTEADEDDVYILDSIYGNLESTLNLKIYRSGYSLRNYAPNPNPDDISSYTQKYYSDEKGLVENNIASSQLNNSSNTAENVNFKFNNSLIVKYKTNDNGDWLDSSGEITTDTEKRVVEEEFKPGMWINLDKNYFKAAILEAGSSNLFNNSVFAEYFKGLYFQVEENAGQDGVMSMLDFSKGKIYIQYHSDITTTTSSGSTTTNAKRELILNLTGNTVNFFDYENSTQYLNGLAASNSTSGDKQLFLKGGNGSVVYIDLFGTTDVEKINKLSDGTYELEGSASIPKPNGVPDQLDNLRLNGWLINEANLIFTIDDSPINSNVPLIPPGMGATNRPTEPRRIYLYDATNSLPLVDYSVDGTQAADTKNNKYGFGGIMTFDNEDDEDNEIGLTYKINITNYINNLINIEDPDNPDLDLNVTLGLSVTENINNSTFAFLKNPNTIGKYIPTGNVMNPLGTILFGNKFSPNEPNYDKRLKLQIYYTKPN